MARGHGYRHGSRRAVAQLQFSQCYSSIVNTLRSLSNDTTTELAFTASGGTAASSWHMAGLSFGTGEGRSKGLFGHAD